MMNDKEKMLRMYEAIHGTTDEIEVAYLSSFFPETYFAEDEPPIIACVKDGTLCWHMTKEELLFDYITRDWQS